MGRSIYLAVGAAALALLIFTGCGGASAGSIVASIGGVSITESMLDHWVDVGAANQRGQRAGRRVVLEHLIELQWVAGEAGEYGIHVTAAEAQKTLGLLAYARTSGDRLDLFPEEAEVQRLLLSLKLTQADRIWLVKLHMLVVRVAERLFAQLEGRVTRAQIASFYRAHAHRFIVPERRDIEVFMTNDLASAVKGKRELLSGKSLQVVVKRRNVSPEAHGGLIMGLVHGSGEKPFEEHIFGAKLGVLLGPIQQALYYVFKVTKAYPPHIRALGEMSVSIRRQIARETLDAASDALRRRWRARTNCGPGYVVALCGS